MSEENLVKEIKMFEESLKSLVNECQENEIPETKVFNLIKENVYKKASKKMHKINRTKNAFTFLKVLFITLILSYLLTRKPFTTDILKMIGRRILINIQPFYDWTEHYETGCLIKNSKYLSVNKLQCSLCESVQSFELINNSDDLNNLTNLITNQRPVKLQGISEHLIDNQIFNLTIEQLSEFYLSLSNEDKVCMFESNLNFGNLFNLMSEINNQYLPLYAHWENCAYVLRKKIRMFYEIPDFMPMMLEFTRENWFLLSFNSYKSENFKKIDVATGTKLAVLMQINGSNRVRLMPKEKCLISGCIKLEATINEKELLIFSTTLFDFEYLPDYSATNLAILLGATY